MVGFDTIELELDSIMSAIKEDNTKNQKKEWTQGKSETGKWGNLTQTKKTVESEYLVSRK